MDEHTKVALAGIAFLMLRSVRITFTKRDGSKRVMRATLARQHIPQNSMPRSERNADRDQAHQLLTVFDMDARDWRSVRLDSITDLEVV